MTIFGWIECLALLLVMAGVFAGKFRRRLMLGAVAIFSMTILLHFLLAKYEAKGYRLFVLPAEASRFTLLGAIVDEQDIVAIGTRLFAPLTGVQSFDGIFEDAYSRLNTAHASQLVTPFFASFFEGDSLRKTWVMHFLPEAKPARPAVYLHGAMGSYVVQCWLVAEVLKGNGFATYCPSLSFQARWFEPSGKELLDRVLLQIRKDHPDEKILFVGLSNGANGLSEYRDSLASEALGFIYISGGRSKQLTDQVPTLVLWGRDDQNIPFQTAAKIEQSNSRVTLRSVRGDHSVFARRHDYFSNEISNWLLPLSKPPKPNNQ